MTPEEMAKLDGTKGESLVMITSTNNVIESPEQWEELKNYVVGKREAKKPYKPTHREVWTWSKTFSRYNGWYLAKSYIEYIPL